MPANPAAPVRRHRLLPAVAIFTLTLPAVASGQPAQDLTQVPIEDLLAVEITSVSRREQPLTETAAAVYVLTQQDLRESGATTLAEALRLVPGVGVARIDGNKWAISARGSNGRFANKMLVLIDGRSVYSPLFSGVMWDVQDTLLEDVERIEIIRGPGASIWGANAVNGVVNVITKSARDTQGGLVVAGTGTEEHALGGVRYGATTGRAAWRVFGKYFDRDGLVDGAGTSTPDGWSAGRGGFRVDWEHDAALITLQGEMYDSTSHQRSQLFGMRAPFVSRENEQVDAAGGHLLAVVRHRTGRREPTFQVYFDRNRRTETLIGEVSEVVDLDVHDHVTIGRRALVVMGGGYRRVRGETERSVAVSLDPASWTDQTWSAFVQSDVSLDARHVLTVGSKFEHNDLTGYEWQPTLRWRWSRRAQTVWSAFSQAVRIPSRVESDGSVVVGVADLPGLGTVPLVLDATRALPAERLRALEAGYRARPCARCSLDVAVFRHDYDRLSSVEPTGITMRPDAPPYVSLTLGSARQGVVHGAEAAASWTPAGWWRLSGSYTWLHSETTDSADRDAGIGTFTPDSGPRHRGVVQSHLVLPRRFALDAAALAVGALESRGVPAYLRLDLQVSWRPSDALTLSVGGENLLDAHHPEYTRTYNELPSEPQRALASRVTWRF